MSKNIYNQSEIKTVDHNPNIKSMTERSITYASKFKRKATKQRLQGMTSTQIFDLAGLPSRLIGEGRADQSLSRWKKLYKRHGENILLQETRGTGQSGPYGSRGQLSLEEDLKKLMPV